MKLASSALSAPPREEKVVWQTKTIGDLCDVVNGGTPKTGVLEYWDGAHLWITPADGVFGHTFLTRSNWALGHQY